MVKVSVEAKRKKYQRKKNTHTYMRTHTHLLAPSPLPNKIHALTAQTRGTWLRHSLIIPTVADFIHCVKLLLLFITCAFLNLECKIRAFDVYALT